MTKDLCNDHAQQVLKDLQYVPEGEAKNALIRIVNYLMN